MTKTMDSKLLSITELAREQYRLEQLIEDIEIQLKLKKEALRSIVEKDLPTAMDDADLKTFKLKNGYTISIEDDMYVGITEERRMEAFTWLRSNGHGSLIKRDLTFKFGKGDEALAKKLLANNSSSSMNERRGSSGAISPSSRLVMSSSRARPRAT